MKKTYFGIRNKELNMILNNSDFSDFIYDVNEEYIIHNGAGCSLFGKYDEAIDSLAEYEKDGEIEKDTCDIVEITIEAIIKDA